MEIVATQKFVRMSPKKLRYVVPLLKGLTPTEATTKLPFVGRRAADPIRKVILTAVANAKQQGISETDLSFKEVQINEGPRLKRWRAGSRGRAKPYVRPMSHIRVVLVAVEKKTEKQTPKTQKEAAAGNDKEGVKKTVKSVKTEKKDGKSKAKKTKKGEK